MSAPRETNSTLFEEAVSSVLKGWTVLQLAVEHGFGGSESKEKSEWMSFAIDQWFSENANLDVYEVEDYLSEVLNKEFDTIADDGSLPHIAKEICTMYELCKAGKNLEVHQKMASYPKAQVNQSQKVNSEEQEIGEQEFSKDSNPPPPQMIMETQNTNGSSTEPVEMEEEEDGWQVVSKNRSKKK